MTLTEYVYDVYGNVKSGDMSISTRLFTGREYDEETGLYFNRARYYSPTLGRFISRDPIDIQDDVNLYSYVGNNPLIYTDRMGREGKLVVAKTYIPFVSEVEDIVTTSKILHYRRNNNLIKIQ